MINRRTVKRQIAATRSLLQLIRVHDIEIPNARACWQLVEALERLRDSTETLAREVYQPPQEATSYEPDTTNPQAV